MTNSSSKSYAANDVTLHPSLPFYNFKSSSPESDHNKRPQTERNRVFVNRFHTTTSKTILSALWTWIQHVVHADFRSGLKKKILQKSYLKNKLRHDSSSKSYAANDAAPEPSATQLQILKLRERS